MAAHVHQAELTATAQDAMPAVSENDALTEAQIVEAIDRKRKELDAQIEHFNAIKEQEFQAHEHWLRKSARQRDLKPKQTAHSIQNRSQRLSSPTVFEGLEPVGSEKKGADGSTVAEGPVEPVSPKAFYGHEGFDVLIQQQQGQMSPMDVPHERDAEFAGLFTPSFLPLLDGSTNDKSRHVEQGFASAYTRDENLTPTDADTQTTDTALFSSSAKEQVTGLTESLNDGGFGSRRLSVSAPGPDEHAQNMHRRSSSSGKSDVSIASRRSSFKDPNSLRSPKRVMFDIGDNTVVSPSTSPLIERKAPLMKKNKKSSENSEEQFEIVKKKSHKSKKHSHHKKGHRVAGEGRSPLPQANGDISVLGPDFVDDFEKVGFKEDDMFSFDEDLDMTQESGRNSRGTRKWTDDAGLGGEDEGVVEGEDAANSTATLTGSSPHAGSLPIEIKWPGRKHEDDT